MTKRVGLDTNVVVSFLTDRNPRQQARAAELVEQAVAGERTVVLHQTVISEAVYVLRNLYGAEARLVGATMRDLLALPGVIVGEQMQWSDVWRLWPKLFPDFGDACLTAAARAGAFDALATFDKAFARRARRQGVSTHWAPGC